MCLCLPQVMYLDNIISAEGFKTDPSKVDAMLNYFQLKLVKALQGFLGLTG